VRTPGREETARYYRRLAWSGARFALLTNLLLFFVGGELKARGKLSGRMADILTWQFFVIAALRRYEAEDRRQEDLPLVRWSLDYAFAHIQEAFEEVYANFPGRSVGLWLRTVGRLGLRLNPIGRMPPDQLDAAAAGCIQRPGSQLDRLTEVQFQAPESDRGAGRLRRAFRLDAEARPLRKRLHEAVKDGRVAVDDPRATVGAAVEAGVLTAEEANLLCDAEAAKLAAVEVDHFTPEQFFDLAASGREKPRKSA
jgi:acyl-CoA dehydrogenase